MGKIGDIKNPRSLFLLDGLGAIVSAIMLGVVLIRLEYMIGLFVEYSGILNFNDGK